MSERAARTREHRGLGGRPLGIDSPLFGGEAPEPAPAAADQPSEATSHLPVPATGRQVDDWGRSERVISMMQPLLDFYYRHWFRVETEGIEHVPAKGGGLLVSNHSGALPPDGPMIMQAIRHETHGERPLYMLGEHWFKGYPGIGMLANKIGLVPGHPANAQRLLADEGQLAIVFPEGQKGTRKVLWQKYRLRRFGRGGFVRTALRAKVPIIPVALVGGEEAMPIWAHMRTVQRLTGLIYAPINHASPWLGPLGTLAYLPAKFKIRFLEPFETADLPEDTIDDAAAVQAIAEEIRARIKENLDEMLKARKSVWLG